MINYEILHRSTKYYESSGYQRIEAPWLVSEAISNITKPANVENYVVRRTGKEKVFVASGEQSFLYLINKGFLPDGLYQTITPCLRDEKFDETHTKYFIKNELIYFTKQFSYEDELFNVCDSMLHDALDFFSLYFKHSDLEIVDTTEGWDINHKPTGVELGSYGVRRCSFCTWAYGTGVAEPRFSRVLNSERE